MKRLGCRWVGTCASSSDASPLYIHDRSNVVQWKGSSLPSSQCTSSDQCIFGKMCSDESENRDFSSWHVIRIKIGPVYLRLIFMVINFVDIYTYIYIFLFFLLHVTLDRLWMSDAYLYFSRCHGRRIDMAHKVQTFRERDKKQKSKGE